MTEFKWVAWYEAGGEPPGGPVVAVPGFALLSVVSGSSDSVVGYFSLFLRYVMSGTLGGQKGGPLRCKGRFLSSLRGDLVMGEIYRSSGTRTFLSGWGKAPVGILRF